MLVHPVQRCERCQQDLCAQKASVPERRQVIGLLLLLPAKGMTRMGGAAMIVLYLLFVVVYLLWPTI